jgi:hypothetical protein
MFNYGFKERSNKCEIKVAKCKQSSILTYIQNSNSI